MTPTDDTLVNTSDVTFEDVTFENVTWLVNKKIFQFPKVGLKMSLARDEARKLFKQKQSFYRKANVHHVTSLNKPPNFRNLKHFLVCHVTFSNVTSSNVTSDVFTRVSSVGVTR